MRLFLRNPCLFALLVVGLAPVPALAGACSLESAKSVQLRSKAMSLVNIEARVLDPLNSLIGGPEAVALSAAPSGGQLSLRFDESAQRSLRNLAAGPLKLAQLNEHDRVRLTADPLRLNPSYSGNAARVQEKPWSATVSRSAPGKATPFFVVGDDGTTPMPKLPERPSGYAGANCASTAGRPKDPSCAFDLPPYRAYPIGDPPEDVFKRRTAIASLATVTILIDSTDNRAQICTGAHLGRGIILSAHHCHRHDAFVAAKYRVYFNSDELTSPWPTGLAAVPLNGDDSLATQLDFLLIKVQDLPEQFAGSFLKLAAGDPWKSCKDGADLEAYVTWHESEKRVTKKFSADSQCVTKTKPVCSGEPGRRVHGCDTTEDSSGAPILLRGGSSIVAVHTSGRVDDDSNCALPTSEIRNALYDSSGAPKIPEAASILWEE
ncbi:hypothetical protein [Bradyrhizobium sp.]|uniref:trypsin-like serine peptidase n=1 Tax=Bradyrhizobium sp. TaxID=376 RepID=UPI002DDCA0C1|nr:hypothetical protein [Bradyrhizobium sp.]HEV2153663.1 hypothetical protein [Bradyrhizobium sp.]